MGMFDYLGGEQIKIFYLPVFSKKDIMTDKPNTWHSGGRLREFNKESELPLKTWYYKYPQNFIAYDFYYDEGDIWIIKNGKFESYKHINELTENDLGEAVYAYYGAELNINNIDDFKTIKIERNEFEDSDNKQDWDTFYSKWYKEDKHELEKQLGEYLDCFAGIEPRKDEEIFSWWNPMEEYLACKDAIKKFINNNEDIVEKYFYWYEGAVEEECEMRKLLNRIYE